MFNRRNAYKVDYEPDLKNKNKRVHLKDEPYLCPKCRRVWQPFYYNCNEYLDGFPKIGCTKNLCKECK